MSVTLKDWQKILAEQNIKIAEPLSQHTTFKIGGVADWFLTPTNNKELISILKLCKERKVEYFLLGAGSNCLVSDKGFSGVIISLEKLNRISFDGESVCAQAGARLSKLIAFAMQKGFSGLEFAVGIPASLGGAVYMNAGAFGHEMADIVSEVWVLKDDKIQKLSKDECQFGYRTSRFQFEKEIILKARLTLKKRASAEILAAMQKILEKRTQMHPLEASAGSVFRRNENFPAGFLIEQAGLKGLRLGDAQISTKHANFIVNLNKATSRDVLSLIEVARNEVYLQFGIELVPEIILLGDKYEDLRRFSHS